MYLHLGDEISVRRRDIVAICDYSSKPIREDTPSLIITPTAKEKKPKAVVFTDKGVYLSALSPLTLRGRG
ncbi:MAG: DUF370 domain-containing protein [Selenomonadaceae bacterium]|nr:DUF370 domain-containing protein [Selenomonadaceae bacterium]